VRRSRHHARRRGHLVLGGLLLAWLLAIVVRTLLGDFTITVPDFWRIVLGTGEVPGGAEFILMDSKLPRAVVGTLAGVALGASGATFQLMARNPLASPDVLGISAGASVAVVFVIAIGSLGGPVGIVPVPVAALAGGLGAAALIALLALGGALRGRRILLVGIALSAALTALTQFLLTRVDVYDAQRSAAWLTGSLNARGWGEATPVLVGVAALVPAALVLAHTNRALLFEDDVVAGWGVRPGRARAALLVIAVCLAALATSAAGPVAFVALVSGQVARRLAAVPDIPPLLAGAAGASLVLVADTVARTALPSQLPVGVLTGLVGAPYLLYLLQRRRSTRGTP
jgi:iron complex transport system permease protein